MKPPRISYADPATVTERVQRSKAAADYWAKTQPSAKQAAE